MQDSQVQLDTKGFCVNSPETPRHRRCWNIGRHRKLDFGQRAGTPIRTDLRHPDMNGGATGGLSKAKQKKFLTKAPAVASMPSKIKTPLSPFGWSVQVTTRSIPRTHPLTHNSSMGLMLQHWGHLAFEGGSPWGIHGQRVYGQTPYIIGTEIGQMTT